MLLLLLSHFSPVQLCVTPWTAAHQAPLSMGFSRQEYWSGVPLPSLCAELQTCLSPHPFEMFPTTLHHSIIPHHRWCPLLFISFVYSFFCSCNLQATWTFNLSELTQVPKALVSTEWVPRHGTQSMNKQLNWFLPKTKWRDPDSLSGAVLLMCCQATNHLQWLNQ